MKFTTNTKPLAEALNLGVVRKSVTNFYQKSSLAQITCTQDTIKINLEVANVISELKLHGSGDEDGKFVVFVDCVLLSDLLNTLDSPTVTLEFVEGGLVVHSGKSQFTLSQVVDDTDLELESPSEVSDNAKPIDLDKKNWKFVGDHQMFAVSMSFVPPVYTYVYVGEDGDVFVGDMVNSIFTHSDSSNFGDTFLLSDTIINLFNSLPEGCKIVKTVKGTYQIKLQTDSFDYCSEFSPRHEDDETGSYSADIIKGIVTPDKENTIAVKLSSVQKFLSQATLLDGNSDALITIKAEDSLLTIKDNNINCELPLEKPVNHPFEAVFKTTIVKSILSNMDEDVVNISPRFDEEDGEEVTSGLIFWSSNLSIVLGSIQV